jgi:hypothetical protein
VGCFALGTAISRSHSRGRDKCGQYRASRRLKLNIAQYDKKTGTTTLGQAGDVLSFPKGSEVQFSSKSWVAALHIIPSHAVADPAEVRDLDDSPAVLMASEPSLRLREAIATSKSSPSRLR